VARTWLEQDQASARKWVESLALPRNVTDEWFKAKEEVVLTQPPVH